MTIDKSLRQYYSRGQLVKPGPGRPGYQGWGPGAGSPGTSSSGGARGGGGPPGGGDRQMTYSAPAPSPHRDPTPVAPTAVAPPSILSRPTPSETIGPSLHGGKVSVKEALVKGEKTKAIRDIIAQQQEEKYGPTADTTKFGETVEDLAFKNHPEYKEQEAERTIKQLSTKEGTKEALREFKALKTGREYRPNISLLDKLKVPHGFTAPETLTSGWKDKFGRGIFNLALSKTPLANLNPLLAGWNLLNTLTGWGKKIDPYSEFKSQLKSKSNITDLTEKRSTLTDTRDDRVGQRDERDGRQITPEAPKDVVTESVQKFSQPQLTELQRKQSILQGYADKGALNKRGQSTLMQLNQMLKQATASAAHGGFIDRPLMGRSRDI